MVIAPWVKRIVAALCFSSAAWLAHTAELRRPAVNGALFTFTLDCETNAIYLVEQSTNLVDWTVVARNAELATNRVVSIFNNFIIRDRMFFRARQTNEPLFQFALLAKRGIAMSGQFVRTDSFDSGDPNYSDGSGHYTNSPGKWKSNGNIASNDTITNTVSIGNAKIFGHVATGPYGTVSIGSSGMVGDIAWQSDSNHVGQIEPGLSTDNMNTMFPSVILPADATSWVSPTGQSFTTNGVVYSMYLHNGDYMLPSGTNLSGKVYVQGNVRLLVQYPSRIALSGQDAITLAPGASLILYGDVVTASFGGNGVQNSGMASQFYYFGTDRNTSLSLGGNGACIAAFYAPNADITLGGGGNWTVDLSGSVIAKTIKLSGNFSFHFDEDLSRNGLMR